jgi:hypothetical protein
MEEQEHINIACDAYNNMSKLLLCGKERCRQLIEIFETNEQYGRLLPIRCACNKCTNTDQ